MITNDYAERLIEKYGDMCLRLAFSYLKNLPDSEDAVQDVFIKVFEKNLSFESDEHEKAWFIRATINVCKNKLKLFWNKNTCSIDDIPESAESDGYDSDSAIMQAVMSLPQQYRIVVHLYYYEGYKTMEISHFIGKRESTVRSILHRARLQIKKILKEEYDFE